MNRYSEINPNPKNKKVGDCTVRALSLGMGLSWAETYFNLCYIGYKLADMPSSNEVWGTYLVDNGWNYHRLQDTCPFCYTINDFCNDHPKGNFIVATESHVVCVKDGSYLDTWDSGDKIPLFYFSKD